MLTVLAAAASDPDAYAFADWLAWFGRFHIVLLHLPIGLFAGVLLLDLAWLFRRKHRDQYASAAGLILGLTVLTALAAGGCGWLLYLANEEAFKAISDTAYENYEAELSWHKWLGTAFAAAIVVLWFVRLLAFKPDGKMTRGLYPLLLLACAGLIGIAGHTGGNAVHGEDFLTAPAPPAIKDLLGIEDTTPSSADPAGLTGDGTGPVVVEPTFFATRVEPIFANNCYICHSDAFKVKGGLAMDTYAGLLEGGTTMPGEALVPGDPDASEIVRRMELPVSDELFMPKGDEQPLPAEDIAAVRAWIAAGASPDTLLRELEPDAPELAANINNPGGTGTAGGNGTATDPPEPDDVDAPAFDAATTEILNELSLRRVTVQPLYQGATDLDVSFTTVATQTQDRDVADLVPLAPHVTQLDLNRSAITDAGLESVAQLTRVQKLILRGTSIGDAGIAAIAEMPELELLVLFGTQVSDASVETLAAMPALEEVYLGDSQVTPEGVARLRELNPELTVVD